MWKNVPEIALFFVHNRENVISKYNSAAPDLSLLDSGVRRLRRAFARDWKEKKKIAWKGKKFKKKKKEKSCGLVWEKPRWWAGAGWMSDLTHELDTMWLKISSYISCG